MLKYLLFILWFFSGTISEAQNNSVLLRKASLGITPQPETEGIIAKEVGGTAASLGVLKGDKILSINGTALTTYEDLYHLMAQYREGEKCEITVLRGKKQRTLKGVFEAKPLESSSISEVIYDQVSYKGGELRVIINKPKKEGLLPALLFIPGYTCSSLDNLSDTNPYKRIIDAYVEAGFVVMRVEKSGLGDSFNTPPCESCDLLDEIENFQVGLTKLESLPYVDTNKLFIYGHSMGGIIAPALSSKNNLAGVIVYGTTAKSWFEYMNEMSRVQLLLADLEPLMYEEAVRSQYEVSYRFFVNSESLQDIAADSTNASILRDSWMYESENNRIWGRNAEYWRQIQEYPHLENWKNTTAKVLVQFGESDFQAFSLADHQQIARTVNYYNTDNGQVIQYPQTDHFFAKSGDMQTAYNKFMGGQIQQLYNEFNFDVTKDAVNWSLQVINGENSSQNTHFEWSKLDTEPYNGKQDDIYFINEDIGWYVNGHGKIFQTKDGGKSWDMVYEKQGSFFRTIAFLDENIGFVGTVGTDYFPNVSDTIPLYGTLDGGKSWTPVQYSGPYVKGLCAIDIVKEPFINHGVTDYKTHIYAVGRVGSPANMMTSHDGGKTWTSKSLQEDAKMLFDILMFDKNEGIACAASSEDISNSNALILKTDDGGNTWKKVYQSNRPFETTWKASFPTPEIGYVTIQSYNPNPSVKQQRVAKTIDGGETWTEIDLVEDHSARQFGIGFLDANHGFVGTMSSGFETKDGGASWSKINLGIACNKIRIYHNGNNPFGYAIGVDVMKLEKN